MNHLHLADIHMHDRAEPTPDKLVVLGNALKEIYEAKLARQFPDRPCVVEFYVPDDVDELVEYQVSFWQLRHADEAGREAG